MSPGESSNNSLFSISELVGKAKKKNDTNELFLKLLLFHPNKMQYH